MAKWIKGAIKHPGRVRSYVKRKYGSKAFEKNGTGRIKSAYLNDAAKSAKKSNNKSLTRAINLARRLRKM